jgi:hypothetical protein
MQTSSIDTVKPAPDDSASEAEVSLEEEASWNEEPVIHLGGESVIPMEGKVSDVIDVEIPTEQPEPENEASEDSDK